MVFLLRLSRTWPFMTGCAPDSDHIAAPQFTLKLLALVLHSRCIDPTISSWQLCPTYPLFRTRKISAAFF